MAIRPALSVRYTLRVYLNGLLFFTFFRILLYAGNIHQLPAKAPFSVIAQSMFMGLRFDTTVSSYLMTLPFLTLLFAEMSARLTPGILRATNALVCLLYLVSLFICTADLPFYANYHSRLNVTIFNWSSSPGFVFRMIWQDKHLTAYLVLYIGVAYVYCRAMKRVLRRFSTLLSENNRIVPGKLPVIVQAVLFPFCMLLAIRGRTDEKSPIQPGTAYFSEYALPNHAGLNPVFTLAWSWTEGWKDENKALALVDNAIARQVVANYLHLPSGTGNLSRTVYTGLPEQKCNVVLVLMESMSAYYMKNFGNNLSLTPNLDSLAARSISFSNFYSAGIHTFNGIFSTLYGHPALMAQHSMEGTYIPSYGGMPYFFKTRGYETVYFTTHDGQFDNVSGFLKANHMQRVICKDDYTGGKVWSTLGIADHEMFDEAIPVFNNYHNSQKPFFAMLMTSSNHSPYIVPSGIPFSPKHTDVRGGCVEYADWAIGEFMKKAAAAPWFHNTIFIFTGDHGSYDGPSYGSLPLGYSKVPCIFFGAHIENKEQLITAPGGQIDIFPTVAGMIGGAYENNTFGIDLLHDSRQWMFFSQDDKIAVTGGNKLYVWQKNRPEEMHDIHTGASILADNRKSADSMKTYAFSMIQHAQWLKQHKMTGMN